MGRITIGFGAVLIALGLIGYLPHQESPTALIPAVFGVVLVVLGVLALRDNMRKHAMHLAAVVGVVGFLAGAGRAISVLVGPTGITNELAFTMTVLLAVVCGVFVGLCVKSFIDARKRRQQSAAQ